MEMPEIQRELGRLDGTVEAQGNRIDALDSKIEKYHDSNTAKLDRIIAFQEQQRGAGRFGLMLAAALGSAAGFLVSWLKA